MASKLTNPKTSLNPHASPYDMRSAAAISVSSPFLPPNSTEVMVVLPSKLPQLPHEMYAPYPQQQQSQLVMVTQPNPSNIVAGLPVSHYLTAQHQFSHPWVCQEAISFYNVHGQHCTVPYLPPCHSEGGGQQDSNVNESDGVKRELEKRDDSHSGVSGSRERRVISRGARRFAAPPPRLRGKGRNGVCFSVEKLWLPRREADLNEERGGDGPEEIQLGANTTLMIKNVPNQFGRRDLLRILDAHCFEENKKVGQSSNGFKSEYDFFYLPMDFVRANLGYGFVNFTNVVGASRFWKAFNNRKWNAGSRKKICEISLAAIQGKDALCHRYENSLFPCHRNDYLPVVLFPPRDGQRRSRPSPVGSRVDPSSPQARGLLRWRKSLNK